MQRFLTELFANRARRRSLLTAAAAVAAIGLLLFTAAFAYAVATLPHQRANNAILRSPSKPPLRKLRELILATQLESRYKKNEILNLYLNTIYYGHRATGIEVASEVYFGKHASELDAAEASMLAALPAAPSYFDPRLHPDRAKARQQYVLDGMVKQRMISQDEADRAAAEKLNFAFKEQRATLAPHFVDYVFEELERLYGPSAVARGGFKVTTSLDL